MQNKIDEQQQLIFFSQVSKTEINRKTNNKKF